MAHRIAELIDQANAARGTPSEAKAAQACQEAMLALWRHRSAWPQGWPPPAAKEIARMLDDAKAPEQMAGNRGTSLVARLHALHHQVLAALVDLLAGVDETDAERAWLDQFGEFLNDDERALLQRVADAPRLSIFADSQIEDPGSRLADLAQQYQSMTAKIAEAVRSAPEDDGEDEGPTAQSD